LCKYIISSFPAIPHKWEFYSSSLPEEITKGDAPKKKKAIPYTFGTASSIK